MVAFRQLFDSPNLSFVAARRFLLHGVTYQVGDDVPTDIIKSLHNRESLIRSRRVIAVTDDLNSVPRAYRKEIKDRALTFKKLKREDQPSEFGDLTIAQVKQGLAAFPNIQDWAQVLLTEVKGKNRSTLVPFIKAGPETGEFTAEDLELFVSDEDSYADGAPLKDFTYPDDAELVYNYPTFG